MPSLDILLLGTHTNRGSTLDNAADESPDHTSQGKDFASVMQATLAPQNQTALSKFSPRPGTKPDAANRSSAPATGIKAPVAANVSGTDHSSGSGSSGTVARAKEKTATTIDTGTPNITPAPAAPVEAQSIPAFLSLPLFITGLVPPPAAPAPKAATSGSGPSQTDVLTGDSLAATGGDVPARTPGAGTSQGAAYSPIPAASFTAPVLVGNGSSQSVPAYAAAVVQQANGNAQSIANGLAIPTTATANLPLPQAATNGTPSDSVPSAAGAPATNPTEVAQSDPSLMNLPAPMTWLQSGQSTIPPQLPSLHVADHGSGQTATIAPSPESQSPKSDVQKLPSAGLEVSSSTAALIAQSPAQGDSQTVSPTVVPVTTATANTSFGASLPTGNGLGLHGMPAPGLAGQNDGTGVAISDSSMKMLQKTNNVAGSDVKVLPVGQNGPSSGNILPEEAAGPIRTADNRSTDLNFSFSNGSNSQPSVSDTATVQGSVDLPALSDARLRTIDRAHDMMSLHSMRLVESKSDSLSVVIKPSVGTELSLELRQNGTEVQAQATLTRGDHQLLSEHWSELQQRLEQRGIKLAPLGTEAGFSANDNGQFRQQQASQEEAAQQASAFAEFASVSPAGGATARLAAVHDGWESWA